MQRFRYIVSLVAVLGVLAHAMLLVRHNGSMVQSRLQHHALSAALDVICYGSGGNGLISGSERASLPHPSNGETECPICMGMGVTAAVLATCDLPHHAPDIRSARIVVVGKTISQRLVAVRPPTRGPPSHA